MQCLRKYEWVKLLRSNLPEGKGIMAYWAKLASHAAFRKGESVYCGYTNQVEAGMWSGGMVGLKRILEVKDRKKAIEIMDKLKALGYITYCIDTKTKHLVYKINDWVYKCNGKECMGKSIYAIDDYGFLCLPRSITERLIKCDYVFEEADAFLDLWCNTVQNDRNNVFSSLLAVVQYGEYASVLTLEALGRRWRWEKTKVWRFFQKYKEIFTLCRLPGNYGCIIFNNLYPSGEKKKMPSQQHILYIFKKLLKCSERKSTENTVAYINRLIKWYSKIIIESIQTKNKCQAKENRIALFGDIIRAYLSLCRNCRYYKYDCKSKVYLKNIFVPNILNPCRYRHRKRRTKKCQMLKEKKKPIKQVTHRSVRLLSISQEGG